MSIQKSLIDPPPPGSVFAAEDVASLIHQRLKSQSLSARKLAAATRIHPAYVSRVLKGRAHFSQDQLFAIGQAFRFSSDENQYLRLLGLYEASGLEAFKRTCKEQLQQLQLLHLNVARRIKDGEMLIITEDDVPAASSLYYGSVLTAKVHMLLTIKRFQSDVDAVAAVLGLSKKRLQSELSKLERLGMITRHSNKVKASAAAVHLEEAHPLIQQNHINWRLDAIRHLTAGGDWDPKTDELHLSVAFTASKPLKAEARKKFQEFVVWLKGEVDNDAKKGREEQLGVLLFDLY
jgi:transcriptional regulator with XRE-family HTH domain